jgi:hypothetical protein
MATIPLGNFGQTVARPTALGNVTMGNPIVETAGRIGAQAAGQIAQIQATQQAEMQAEQQRMQAEQRRLQLEQEREAKQAAAEALRAKSLVVQQTGEDALIDLRDEVANGVIEGRYKPDEAEKVYNERATKVLGDVGSDLPDERRILIQGQLTRVAGRGGNDVRKAVTQRNKQEVTASIKTTLEGLQRRYEKDPAGATANAMALLDELGPSSTLNPEQVATLRQRWKEETQYTAGYSLVSRTKDDRKGLAQAEKAIQDGLPDLDPQRKASLLDRIEANRMRLDQKAELAAQRAQRETERRMNNAKAEFDTFQAMADKGTQLAPEYIDRVMNATAGTPYQGGIKQLAQMARDTGGLAAQPVRAQQQALDQVNAVIAKQGRSPELDKRKAQIEGVLRGSQQDLERDGLRAGLERGVIEELKPLDMTKGIPGLVQQLQQRAPMAQRVSMWAGRSVSPMTDDEAGMLKQQLDSLPAKERSGMVAALANAIGPQAAQGLAAQIDKKDKALSLAFSYEAAMTTPAADMWGKAIGQGRYISELILKGQQAKKDGTSTKGQKDPEVKASKWGAYLTQSLDGVYPDQKTANDHKEAALLIVHGLAAEKGGEVDQEMLDQAVGLAVRGSVLEHNGKKIPLPAGNDESSFNRRLRSIAPEEVARQTKGGMVMAGGVPMPVDEFVKTIPGQPLMAVSRGKYAVLVGGRPVINESGDYIVIGVK